MIILILLVILLLIYYIITRNQYCETEPFTTGFRTFYRPRIRNVRHYMTNFHNKYYGNMIHYLKKKRMW